MGEATVETLNVKVESDSQAAANGLDALVRTLEKLKKAATGGAGLSKVSKQLTTLNTALNTVSAQNTAKLSNLTKSLTNLLAVGKLKLSSTVSTQITSIGTAIRSLDGVNVSPLQNIVSAITPLSTIGKANLNSFISQLTRLPQAITALSGTDFGSFSSNINQLVSALAPLSSMGKNNLTSFITQLMKLPAMMASIQSIDMGTLTAQIQALANAFAPLANQMQKISAGFAAFPARIQRLITQTNNLAKSNRVAGNSFTDFAAKLAIAVVSLRRITSVIGSWITKSNKYIEDINLFTASMGEYADSAKQYAERVGEVMGIDPGEWMRNQGLFMTLATGFGVVSDRAEIMSRNLTQLGYDISSFFNISYSDAMAKLQSGLAGEFEPLRRIGYDLSVARLQEEAYRLGINKRVQAMTQAEKAELRYYAIMTQVTVAQGDMARTLEAPANQLRILKAQVEQAARAFGNIFIPAINAILPYAIALLKVVRMLANEVANLVGFNLPEIDYSGLETVTGSGVDETLENAAENAKALKNNLLGIDELNIISKEETENPLEGLGLDNGLGFELPEYDFLGDAINTKVDDIVKRLQEIIDKVKEWLGLNEKISSWADLMKTNLYDILSIIGAIGAALLAWNLLKFLTSLGLLPLTLQQILGLALAIGGAVEFVMQYMDAWVNGVDWSNLLGQLAGMAAVVGGLAIAFGKIGAGIGLLITGIPMLVLGIKEMWQNGVDLPSMLEGLIGAAATVLGSGLLFGTIGAAIAAIPAGVALFITGLRDALLNGLDLLNAILIPAGATLAGAGIGAIIGALGGPIGAGIGALIGLAVGLIVDFSIWLYQHWDEVVLAYKLIWETIGGLFEKAWDGIVEYAKGIPGKITDAFEKLDKWVKEIPKNVKKKLDEVGKYLDELPSKITKVFTDMKEKVKTFFSDMWKPIKDYDWSKLGSDIGGWLGGAVRKAIDFVKDELIPWVEEMGESIKGGLTTFFTSTLPAFFTETIPQTAAVIWEFIKKLPERMLEIIKSVGSGFVDVGSAIIDGIVEGLQTVWQAITDFVGDFVKSFKEALGIHSPSTVFRDIGEMLIEGFLEGISGFTDMMTTIQGWSSSVVEWFKKGEDGKGIIENFKETAQNIITGFSGKISSAYTTVQSSITTWASKVKSWFTDSSFGGVNSDNFSTFANNIITGFSGKISSAYTTVQSSITTWANNVKSWFTGIASKSTFEGFASDIIDGFKSKVTTYYTQAKTSMNTWADNVKKWFTDTVSYSSFYSLATNVIDGFIAGITDMASSTYTSITNWANDVIGWAMGVFDVNSPSRVFYDIGRYDILGFNNAILKEGKSSKLIVDRWAESLTKINPSMIMSVDTSAMRYYDSTKFAKSVSADVSASNRITVEEDTADMEKAIVNALMQSGIITDIRNDIRRQADKDEKTTVQIGSRVVNDAVTVQRKANGYSFVKTTA
jgi:hypothetical protein